GVHLHEGDHAAEGSEVPGANGAPHYRGALHCGQGSTGHRAHGFHRWQHTTLSRSRRSYGPRRMTTPEYPGKGGNGEQRRTHRQDAGARAPRTVTPGEMPAINASAVWFPLSRGELEAVVRDALDEDGALNDLTTLATVHADRKARATLVAREQGVIAGVPLAVEAFRQLDPRSSIRIDAEDGTRVSPGQSVLFLSGHARSMLSAERVALNFLQRLSGIATGTHQFVQAVKGTRAQILDTRKTTPGWRRLEKYAVRCGGGVNHR